MVVFTCNHCGESVHKPRVEKHYMQCRKFKSLTCVDCLKDFKGEEFFAHTKCITEEERYAAKGSLPNGVVKKGEVKQESWMDMIKSIVKNEQNASSQVKKLLNMLTNYSNVPRKKQKFMNFIKNSTGGRINLSDIETVWNIIESYKEKQKNESKTTNGNNKIGVNTENQIAKTNGITNGNKRKSNGQTNNTEKPKKKLKTNEDLKSDESQNGSRNDKFSFKDNILNILNSKGSISLKKLQKKILKAYKKEVGEIDCEERLQKKINKKLKKLTNVTICDETVQLIGNGET